MEHTQLKNTSRPIDAMNIQASQEETADEEFDEHMQDDITLLGLNPSNFLPMSSKHLIMQKNGRFTHADDVDEEEQHEPAPYGEGEMPNNVGSMMKKKVPEREYREPAPAWDDEKPAHKRYYHPSEEEYKYPRRQVRRPDPLDEAEEIEEAIRNNVKNKQRMRREKEMSKLKEKIDNPEERTEFEKAVKNHRKIRRKARKDKKKKEKRKYRDAKEKLPTSAIASDEEHDHPQHHDRDESHEYNNDHFDDHE